ncbi:MAG: hypothetical protein EPO61_06120 [Nitrospirae bacterium]|nr:MAG: hypothetical protein EPO61_06120 [Nitrospirota bacterium]
MAFDWRWAWAGFWESLPSPVQDAIKNWFWQTLIGFACMMAYFAWAAFQEVQQWPGEIIVLIGFAFFVIGFALVNQIRWRQLQQKMRANIEQGEVPKQKLPDATPAQLAQRRISGVRLHLADLVKDGPILRDKIIEGCQIVGPAVIALLGGNTISRNELDGGRPTFTDYVWIVPEGHSLVGTVGLENCEFRRSHFLHISFIATEQQASEWRKEFHELPRRS